MTPSVTDIIVARSQRPEVLTTMALWSAVLHVAGLGVLLLLGGPAAPVAEEPLMTISLGGAPGPRTGGMTQTGARAVQAPQPELASRPVLTPPAAAPPRMTLPDPQARPRPQTRPPRAADQAAATKANTGPQPTDGNARAETAVKRGQGFGISSSGGAGGPVQLEVQNFCCPDYLALLVTSIQHTWDQNQGVVGSTTIRFVIQRDGTIQAARVERPSGFIALDNAALRAVQLTQLPPLPTAFPEATLPVHVRFDYQR